TITVDAPQEPVWFALSDWELQSDWILLTRVRATSQEGRGIGAAIEAWTGIGPLGFLDTMEITTWDPPRSCQVRHTGRTVRGTGGFELSALGPDRTRVLWTEQLRLPLGPLGRIGWALGRPGVRWGVRRSLSRFKELVETRWQAVPRDSESAH